MEPIVEPYDFSLDFIKQTIAEKPYASAIYLVTDLATKNKLIKDLDEKTLGKVLFVNGFLRKSFYLKNNKTLFLSFNKMGVNINSKKYSNQSFVIADFNPVETGYGVNRFYTTMLISLGFMSFILITYGLHSSFSLYGIS